MERVLRFLDVGKPSDRRQTLEMPMRNERRKRERREGSKRRKEFERRACQLRTSVESVMLQMSSLNKSFWSNIYLWATLSVFVLGFMFLTVNFGKTPMDVSSLVSSQAGISQATHDQTYSYEYKEVLIYDPSKAVSSELVDSGYAVIETIVMKELDIRIQRLSVPSGMSVQDAIYDLRLRYPSLDVDVNTELTASGRS